MVASVYLPALTALGDMRARGIMDQTIRPPPAHPYVAVYPDDSTYVFIPVNRLYIDLG